jgi:hypothetical protein
MIIVVFMISILNLGLGFMLAVHLGFGPPKLCRSWEKTLGISQPGAACHPQSKNEPTPEIATPSEPNDVVEPPPPPDPAPVAPVPKDTETKRDHFQILCHSVEKIDSRLSELNKQLNNRDRWPPGKNAWSFVTELQEICEPYLRHLSDALDSVEAGEDAASEGTTNRFTDEIQALMLDQMAQLETTSNNLQYMDFDSGLTAALERLIAETENIHSLASRLNNVLQAVAADSELQTA